MKVLRRSVVTLCATVGLVVATGLLPAHASLPPTSTSAATGSASYTSYPTLRNVRWSAHDSFDRIVFDFSGGTPAYRVAYGTLEGLGTGDAVWLEGGADLIVDFDTARAHDGNGNPTYRLRTLEPNLRSLLQVKWGGDYEGYVRAGLGIRERVGFRVMRLSGPPRIVIDVAHRTPFATSAVSAAGTATNVVVDGVRGGRQTGYDRLVLDVQGSAAPGISVRYAASDSSTLLVRLSATGSAPRASYVGPATTSFGYTGLRSVRATDEGSSLLFRVSTARRNGFRVMLLSSPTRVVVDVRH